MSVRIKRAVVSVSDKSGIVDFSKVLTNDYNVEVLSTGGTAKLLRDTNGLPVKEISEYTGYPEMMDGRVRTLHPRVHGGILNRRTKSDFEIMQQHGIEEIDLVIVSLYQFKKAVTKQGGCTLEDAIENIDIGGPAMIRSSAKNWEHVTVVCDPCYYTEILEEMKKTNGYISRGLRFKLARAAFEYTAKYDGMIAEYLGKPEITNLVAKSSNTIGGEEEGGEDLELASKTSKNSDSEVVTDDGVFSNFFYTSLQKRQNMRYGENPHQKAALYLDDSDDSTLTNSIPCVPRSKQLQGKELSYNNIADADAALDCCLSIAKTKEAMGKHVCVIVKHANPCGVAISGTSAEDAYQKAYQADSTSAFGGIIAFNKPLDGPTAQKILDQQFLEVLLAPIVLPEAVEVCAKKKNIRVLEYGKYEPEDASYAGASGGATLDYKRIRGGLLVQDRDELEYNDLKVVSKRQPTEKEMSDLLFAWNVAKFVKSNAIVYCKDGYTVGIGAGQMSRVFSSRIAVDKAKEAELELKGSAMASDAFFPFRDGIDAAATTGVSCIIQPGGSIRDSEIIAAADEHGMSMVFTGMRHFKH